MDAAEVNGTKGGDSKQAVLEPAHLVLLGRPSLMCMQASPLVNITLQHLLSPSYHALTSPYS